MNHYERKFLLTEFRASNQEYWILAFKYKINNNKILAFKAGYKDIS